MSRRYRSQPGDRYDNYAEISARFASTGTCGHEIKKGDRIGWYPSLKKTQCAACWTAWVAENYEADRYEANLPEGMAERGA